MFHLIGNEELVEELQGVIPTCKTLNIISAFVTMPAILWLSEFVQNSDVCIVGRFSPKDFIEGASSIEAIRTSITKGYSVRCLSNLHAKIYQVDSELIFTGSANMTGKGLSIVNEGNLEACAQVAATDASKKFINTILHTSIELSMDTLDNMEAILEQCEDKNNPPFTWPENLMTKANGLLVSDLPLSKPGGHHEFYTLNPSLEFAIIEANRHSFNTARKLFKHTKAYRWLKTKLKESNSERGLRYGQVSAMLHAELQDDPAPYRRDIKELQTNLYEYISHYVSDEMEIYVPGARSQVIKLIV